MADPREDRLPVWVRELLADLRRRLEAQPEPLTRELAKLRPEVARLKARNEALIELLECAARGGHQTAQQVVEVLEQYRLDDRPLSELVRP